jgi:hypothetical protein
LIQPAGKNGVPAQSAGLARQNDEDGLRDFLGGIRAAGLSQRGGIHQVQMARHQCGKRLVGIPVGILPQQIHVGRVLHLPMNVRRRKKVPTYFDPRRCRLTSPGTPPTGSSAVRGNGWLNVIYCSRLDRGPYVENILAAQTSSSPARIVVTRIARINTN